MAEYLERQESHSFSSKIDLIDSLITDTAENLAVRRKQLVDTIEKGEAKIALLYEIRARETIDTSKGLTPALRTSTEICPELGALASSGTENSDHGAIEHITLNAGMKLADAVRAIVRESGPHGVKTNDVVEALEKIGHPISTAADVSKKVGSALCALKPKAISSVRKQRAGKNDLYRDNETGRFYSPEAWIARKHSSNALPSA